METNDLKNVWASLDSRLKNTEILNERMIKDIIKTKSTKYVNRLIGGTIACVVAAFLLIPFIAYSLEKYGGKTCSWDVLVVSCGIICFIFGCIIYPLRVKNLMKFDLSKNINDNINCINKFNIQIEREKLFMKFIAPYIIIMSILIYAELKATISLWIFLFSLILLVIFYGWWAYKSHYKKMEVLMKNLEELKGFEEEIEK